MVWWWYITLWLVSHMGGQPVTLLGTNDDAFAMMQGYYKGEVVQYVPFASSDMRTARMLNAAVKGIADYPEDCGPAVDFAPALACTMDKDVLSDVYFIGNLQTVVFDTDPTQDDYTPLWLIHNVQWARGATPRALLEAGEVQDAIDAGELVEITPPAVLNATIVIDSDGGVTPQALQVDYTARKIWLPVLWTYNDNKPQLIVVTDTSDEDLANSIGARFSKRLANAADCGDATFAFVNPPEPETAVSWMQLPVTDTVQTYSRDGNLQTSRSYTPLRTWTLMAFTQPNPNPIGRSMRTLNGWLKKGFIEEVPTADPIVTNSPVLHSMPWQ